MARKTFWSIAQVYAWRADHETDPEKKKQFQQAADLAFRQAYVLCPFSPEAIHRYVQLLLSLHRSDDAFLLAQTSLRIAPDDDWLKNLVRSLNQHNG